MGHGTTASYGVVEIFQSPPWGEPTGRTQGGKGTHMRERAFVINISLSLSIVQDVASRK
jgi:hypothetical protein